MKLICLAIILWKRKVEGNKVTKFRILILLLSILCLFDSSLSFDWKYDQGYQDERLYLHVATNYTFDQDWCRDWQKNYLRASGLRMNYGSVTTSELLSDFQILINEKIANGWKFHSHFIKYDSRHRNDIIESNFMGLEKSIFSNFSLFALFNPYFDKEKIDSKVGLIVTNSNQKKYLRLSYVFEDFVYDQKNSVSGYTIQNPRRLDWKIRTGGKNWILYSDGQYSRPFKRKFQDRERSPEINWHSRAIDDIITKLYLRPDKNIFIEYRNWFYHFYEAKNFWNPVYNFSYNNNIYQNSLYATFKINKKIDLRYEFHHIYQNSKADGYQNYDYQRGEIFFPDVFVDYTTGRDILTFGYFGTSFKWDKTGKQIDEIDQKGYEDKLIFGWQHIFSSKTKLKLSISHSTTYHGFGGGNIQYMMFF